MLMLMVVALSAGVAVPYFTAKWLPRGFAYTVLAILLGYVVSVSALLLLVAVAFTYDFHPGMLIAVCLFLPPIAVWRGRKSTSRQSRA